jgi:hypothetical protein
MLRRSQMTFIDLDEITLIIRGETSSSLIRMESTTVTMRGKTKDRKHGLLGLGAEAVAALLLTHLMARLQRSPFRCADHTTRSQECHDIMQSSIVPIDRNCTACETQAVTKA